MAGGQFVKIIEKRLRTHGHSDENIKTRVFGIESGHMRVNYAVNKHKLVGTYSSTDFLSWETDMKFDVIVGNPPYQDNRSKTAKLWFEFTKKSIALDPSYIAYITPNNWFYEPLGLKVKSTTESLLKGSIIYGDVITPNEYFSVNEDIGMWVWKNEQNLIGKFKATWFGQIVEKEFVYEGTPAIVDASGHFRTSIEEKLKLKNNTSVRVEGIKGMTWGVGHPSVGLQDKLSEITTDVFSIPVRLSPARTMYTDFAEKKLGVCITISGYYYVHGNDDKYMPITDDPTGLSFLKILCNNVDEATNVKSFLTSKLYRSYVQVMVNKSFNNYALARLPFLGRDKYWTDSMIYEYFGLTQDEIDYVESSVK
jgi:hypothetical protein